MATEIYLWFWNLNSFGPIHVFNGEQVLDQSWQLKLPPNAHLLLQTRFQYVYNIIAIGYVITMIEWRIRGLESKNLLPEGFLLDAVISALIVTYD